MKVLLANPPGKSKVSYESFYPNLGLLYLASYCQTFYRSNLDLQYLEGYFHSVDSFINEVSKHNPDIIGLSFSTLTSEVAYETVNRLKEEFPHVLIVCGGPHPTVMPSQVLQRSQTDVVVIGEGERTFLELLQRYSAKRSFANVTGIAIRHNKNVLFTPKRPLIANLDSIPFPAWNLVNLKRYPGYIWKKASPDVCVISSRGCPFNCTFCSNPVWKINKPWVRFRSPDNVASEVKMLWERYGAKEIYDFSDEFNANLRRSVEICKKIAALKLDMNFKLQLRADKITEELAKNLKAMGCWLVGIGIESGNPETLRGINKQITLTQVIEGCRKLKKYGVKTDGFFMIFNIWEENGKLMYETPEMCEKTFKFVRKMLREGLLDHFSWTITTPLPGSRLYEICKKYDLIGEESFSKYTMDETVFSLLNISKKDVNKMKFKGMWLQAFHSLKSGDLNLKNPKYIRKLGKLLTYTYKRFKESFVL